MTQKAARFHSPGEKCGLVQFATLQSVGHADTKITEIYAVRNLELAMRIMREIG